MSEDGTPTKRHSTTLSAKQDEGSRISDMSHSESNHSATERERGSWGNQIEFLLSTLGMAVGLGNIWRFPTRAYNNGGSAFLIPYISCALLFGLPSIYLEFLLGQYHRTTAPVIFRRIAPAFQGVGWMAVAVSSCVSIYYVIIIGWSAVYMVSVAQGHTTLWNRCDNPWNNASTCLDLGRQHLCDSSNSTKFVFFNNSCYETDTLMNISTVTATEQYFFNYIVEPSSGFNDFNRINWKSFTGVSLCWILVALILWKGVDYMGKASYVIVVLPYIIIFALFLRGITLDGASEGIYYYLGNPDWSKVFAAHTWGEALKQLCFSLGIGYGGMIGLSSYNKPNNNCYRDALIVIVGDTIMSIIGGAAVFSTLGFLAKQRGCAVDDVVNSGLSLAFVAFPEAMSHMPIPWLWSFLFFVMIFLLGISTEIAYVNVFCSALCDHIVILRKKKCIVVVFWCLTLYLIGLVMITDGGYFWFIMFDEYAAGVSSCVAVTAEVLVISFVYGRRNQLDDMLEMFGPANSKFSKIFGKLSPYFGFNWMLITPILGSILIVLASIRDYPFEGRPDVFPVMFDIIGWTICLLPVVMVPIFAIVAIIEFKVRKINIAAIFMMQPQLKSYKRIYHQMSAIQRKHQRILPDREPWDDKPTGFKMPHEKWPSKPMFENSDESQLIANKIL
ncbi:unnamed protein product [Caenorhabditis bovis]|uniref:Uncharacterized protein n=1 Tax=Caenorhabditis bovis TaxID=2654633 RepID=A0A8S1F7S4_9PELO|nr:unnamed protein product [Caenorhabditis bovis]